MHIQCAKVEDDRNRDTIRQGLDFIAKVWVGEPEGPTDDNPIIEQSVKSGGTETITKRVLNVDYDDQVKKLRESSVAVGADTKALVEKMRVEMEAEKKEETNG